MASLVVSLQRLFDGDIQIPKETGNDVVQLPVSVDAELLTAPVVKCIKFFSSLLTCTVMGFNRSPILSLLTGQESDNFLF